MTSLLGDDLILAKKELLTHTDDKITELGKTLNCDLNSHIEQAQSDKKDLQNEMLDMKVKTEKTLKELLKIQLTSLEAKLYQFKEDEKNDFTNLQTEMKSLTQNSSDLSQSHNESISRRIDTLDNKLTSIDNKINEDVEDLAKNFKETQIDNQIVMESMKDSIKKCNQISDKGKLMAILCKGDTNLLKNLDSKLNH